MEKNGGDVVMDENLPIPGIIGILLTQGSGDTIARVRNSTAGGSL